MWLLSASDIAIQVEPDCKSAHMICLPCAAGGSAQLETPAGRAALQSALQAVLDHYRKRDVAAALAGRAARRQRQQEAAPASAALMPSRAVSDIESDSGWFDAARPERVAEPAAAAAAGSDAEASGAEEWDIQPAPPSPSCGARRPEVSAQESAEPGATAEGRQGGLLAAEPRRQPAQGQKEPQQTPWVDLSTVGPLAVALEEVLKGAGPGRVSALLIITPQRSTILNSGGLSSVDGWPIKCGAISLTCGT